MENKTITRKDYTTWGESYQLSLPLNYEIQIPENDPVRLLRHLIGGMNLTALYNTYSRIEKKYATPRQMLSILVYADMNGIHSSRKVESACKRDINFMYLLEGKPAPDHAKVARFRRLHLAPCMKETFAEMTALLASMGELSEEQLFIDGTKIESCANKYTFVWKKSVTKQMGKLMEKIPSLFTEAEEDFDIRIAFPDGIRLRHMKRLRRRLKARQKNEGVVFVHGTGKRKGALQKLLEKLDEAIRRIKDYTNKLHIAGERNSYSKTDKDATFMRMKEDAMKNGQLKPAYNIQFGVDAQYVVWVTEGPQPSDTTTLIPFLKDMEQHTGMKYPRIVADAGYESEENYLWLEGRGQEAYIKPTNYETSKKRSAKKDIGRRENMAYDPEEDSYTCANGKKLIVTGIRKCKTKTGYVSEKTQYSCADCKGCQRKAECIRAGTSKTPLEERSKRFEVAKKFQEQRAKALARITSPEGIELRVNRSIQAEGAFAQTKGNLSFRRFLSRGRKNILVEAMLLAMAHNMTCLHHKIQAGKEGRYLFPVPVAA
ncbi:MAG: IS1182 family transposase [Schwartzia sp.]|nr:IS1182 family transposase [Schwartzia sp. (in: firmicutes)]